MIPTAWQFSLLALGSYRAVRLIGWDDMPLIIHVRNRVIGWDKQAETVGRPMLWHFLTCGYCLGFWVALAVYGAWLASSKWTLYVCVPFAMSAVVGLVTKRLDA